MKISTRELTGAALDWAVAKREGLETRIVPGNVYPHILRSALNGENYTPSVSWAQGGPIIDREIYSFSSDDNSGPEHGDEFKVRYAWCRDPYRPGTWGDSFLIAAMRCYVLSKFGDEIEVPDELLDLDN